MNYKPIEKEFTSNGFRHTLIRRDGDIAIYHKVGEKNAIHTRTFDAGFETVMITRHNGYELGGVKIDPAEVYPSASQWGTRGWTYKTLLEADHKFNTLMGKSINVTDEIPSDDDEEVTEDETPQSISPRIGSGRGRKKVDRPALKYPDGEFSIKELAELNKTEYPITAIVVKEAIEAGTVVLSAKRKVGNGRGKKTNFYKVK